MAKHNLDESGELKRLAEEFEKMATTEKLQEANDAVATQLSEETARAEGHVPRKTAAIAFAVAGALLVLIAIVVFAVQSRQRAGQLPVPSLVGKDIAMVRETLLTQGFSAKEQYDATSRATAGQVIAQMPRPGDRLPAGGVVTVTIAGAVPRGAAGTSRLTPGTPSSTGPTTPTMTPTTTGAPTVARVTVPKIEGLNTAQAKSQLEAVGLRVQMRTVVDNTRPADIVLAAHPRGNMVVDRGTVVRLDVNAPTGNAQAPGSDAANAATGDEGIVIANYMTQASQVVMDDLRAKGLSPSWRMEVSPQLRTGYVIRTDPPAGTRVQPGARVTVIIAR